MSEFPQIDVPAIETWRDGGATFDWNGHEIFYRIAGEEDAPPLLLLHGSRRRASTGCRPGVHSPPITG
ncbi:MAG: hypothetical protein HKN78_00725 [Sphingomonadaceae bacterium]|nr:hypothetical protein [Sphingomonadaceae bacterium]